MVRVQGVLGRADQGVVLVVNAGGTAPPIVGEWGLRGGIIRALIAVVPLCPLLTGSLGRV